MRVAVIGAGPAGLTTLKYLIHAHENLATAPIEARLFETEAAIGGTFRHRTYEDAEVGLPLPALTWRRDRTRMFWLRKTRYSL
jgi:cation diffusion facilitator CzcD-associated flavoprotein CzcO